MSSINLRTLQRIDSSITFVVESASQAAVYKFGDNNKWKSCDYEGSLHVFHRSEQPKFGWIVMNRSNPTNLVELITPGVEIELREPYLLYKNAISDIYCIWFYNTVECRKVYNIIEKFMATPYYKSLNSS